MRRQSRVLLVMIMFVIALMGVGYAALSNVTLTITGTATASANADNFKVYFTGNVTESDETNVAASAAANAITATVDFSGMNTIGQEQSAIFEIENGSEGIDASSVKVTAHDVDTSYFQIDAVMCNADGSQPVAGDNPVLAGAKTYVKVTAKLLKNPLTDNTTTTINVKIEATPDVSE